MPPPAILPPAGRDVERAETFDPEGDTLAFWESVEELLVAVDGAIVVLTVAGGGGAEGRTTRGGFLRLDDPNPDRHRQRQHPPPSGLTAV